MKSILLIYTGGTIGMVNDPITNKLNPFDFKHLTEEVPELKKFKLKIDTFSFKIPMDSSNMQPSTWSKLAHIIDDNYLKYDGFVILHGSDTMAYTASALSFSLENIGKPVILTGSQLPIGTIRTDGKENLITAIEIAGSYKNGSPIVPEVAIYFEYQLYRGNRTTKINTEHFEAFESFNYPKIAEAGVNIRYNTPYIQYKKEGDFSVSAAFDNNILILKLFPGINQQQIEYQLNTPGLKAVIIESFGAGNGPSENWFYEAIKYGTDKNLIIVNITQCKGGSVMQGKYETSSIFEKLNVLSGRDITSEAAVTKLMFLMGKYDSIEIIKEKFVVSICGEMT